MQKKQVSCSKCFKPVQIRNTSIMSGERICHECKGKIIRGINPLHDLISKKVTAPGEVK